MTENIGKNLKSLAQILGWLSLAAGTVVAIYMWVDWYYDFIEGLYAFGIGLGLFLSSWPMYGFGQLIEDVAALRKNLEQTTKTGHATGKTEIFNDLPDL